MQETKVPTPGQPDKDWWVKLTRWPVDQLTRLLINWINR
jgi:hypothetical protein